MNNPLPPGATIGILGGGQLGRMTALAAARLGYRTHVYHPDPGAPATQVTDRATLAGWEDERALDRFAQAVDVVTLEFENVPAAAVARLAGRVPVHPGADALAICQDRLEEKAFAARHGIATARFASVPDAASLPEAMRITGLPAILKTTREGYDGKGQARIEAPEAAEAAWIAIGRKPAILESVIDFTAELSVITARSADGAIAVFPPAENLHEGGILRVSRAPAPLEPAILEAAEAIGRRLADAMGVIGLLAVELFLDRAGRLLVNEMAPRPHNSGHWTMDAAAVDQFEQLVRAVAGLPLGAPDALFNAEMTNLIGADVEEWPALLAEPGARLHLYGKADTRSGRKMGHVNRLGDPLLRAQAPRHTSRG